MLATQPNRRRQLLCRHRPPGVGDDYIPRRALKRSAEAQCLGRFTECLAKAGRERVGMNQVARGVFVDSLDDEIDESEAGAPCGSRRIRRAERHYRKEWCA